MASSPLLKTALAVSALLVGGALTGAQANSTAAAAPGGAPAGSSSTLGVGGSAAGQGGSASSLGVGGSSATAGAPGASAQPGSSASTDGIGSAQSTTSPSKIESRSSVGTQGNASQDAGTNGSGGTGSSAGANGPSSSSSATATASATVNLTTQQKTVIRQTVINNYNAPRVSNANFNVGVGSSVPSSVRFAPLPQQVVNIVPQFAGFDFFLYTGEIVIVQPGTRRIVAILPAA